MAAVMKFANEAERVLNAASNPVADLTDAFGSDFVMVADACGAAAVALEEEEAATGAPVTDQAAICIVRSIVDQVTLRASRTMALAPRTRIVSRVPRVRTQRAPRARRVPRRAVRLSAVAAAGDGPPPPPSDSDAPSCTRDRTQLARPARGHVLVAPFDDVVERIGAPRERRLMSTPRTLLSGVVRRHVCGSGAGPARRAPFTSKRWPNCAPLRRGRGAAPIGSSAIGNVSARSVTPTWSSAKSNWRTARRATISRPRAWGRATIRADQRSRCGTTCPGRWRCGDERARFATEHGRRERQDRSRPRTRALRVGGERSTGRAARGWGRRPVDSSSTLPVRITADRLHAHALRRAIRVRPFDSVDWPERVAQLDRRSRARLLAISPLPRTRGIYVL